MNRQNWAMMHQMNRPAKARKFEDPDGFRRKPVSAPLPRRGTAAPRGGVQFSNRPRATANSSSAKRSGKLYSAAYSAVSSGCGGFMRNASLTNPSCAHSNSQLFPANRRIPGNRNRAPRRNTVPPTIDHTVIW